MSDLASPLEVRATGNSVITSMSKAALTERIQEHIHFILCTYPGINRTQLSIGTINQTYGRQWKSVLAGMIRKGDVLVRAHFADNGATGKTQKVVHLFSARDSLTQMDRYPNDPDLVQEI